MMDCDCRKTVNLELNKELLKVFLEDSTPKNPEAIELSDLAQFTVFNERHMKQAHKTAQQLSEEDVSRMLDALSDLKNRHPRSHYVDYLARITLFKHQDTKNMTLPPASQTLPRAFFPKDQLAGKKNLLGKQADLIDLKATLDPEYKLNWWREDPGISEHHYNWHLYYPYSEPEKDRQGELFAYMHQQMLARYNFERLAVGLSPVTPFGPGIGWDKPLPQGFNPQLKGYSFRASSMSIPDSVTNGSRHIVISNMVTNGERLKIAIARNYLEDPTGKRMELTMDRLGCCVEANTGSVNKKLYGNIHNNGHVVISLVNDPDGRYNVDPGVMSRTETAAKDPVFYRWHKFIDTIFEAYRGNLPSYTKQDLKMDGIKIGSVSTTCEPDPQLGPCQNDLVNHLYTRMIEKEYTVCLGQEERAIQKTALQYIPFKYNFTVQNTTEVEAKLVFRVFLAPTRYAEEELDDRRNDFIELDRFVEVVQSGPEQTITRSSDQSSVLLPPSPKLQDIRDGNISAAGSQPPCGCGWPRNLLIPRGTSAGLKADLYVLATDWKEDAVNPRSQLSGSVSYCGKTGSSYPDKRPMGFPFDRELSFATLEKMVADVPNSSAVEVKIKFLGHDSDMF